jgi:hypothetical protein
MRNAYKILVGKPEGKNHSEDLGVEGKVYENRVLSRIFGTKRKKIMGGLMRRFITYTLQILTG